MAAIVAAQTKGRERFGRMVSFFEGVGKGETAGYGWKDVPKDPPGSKERYRKQREAKAKASSAVGT
jgi:chlorophyllide a reductase subunit Y